MVYTDTDQECPVADCVGNLRYVEPDDLFSLGEGAQLPSGAFGPPPHYECELCFSQWDLALEPLAF